MYIIYRPSKTGVANIRPAGLIHPAKASILALNWNHWLEFGPQDTIEGPVWPANKNSYLLLLKALQKELLFRACDWNDYIFFVKLYVNKMKMQFYSIVTNSIWVLIGLLSQSDEKNLVRIGTFSTLDKNMKKNFESFQLSYREREN